jgi:hypothetical protein
MIEYVTYSREQKRHLEEVTNAWRDHTPLLLERHALVGGLQWKTVGGNEYLYRYHPDPITKKKKSTSLGRRGPQTELAYAEFIERREKVTSALTAGEAALESQARVTKALRLGRVEVDVASVFQTLWTAELTDHLMLVSNHAVHGYETAFLTKIGTHIAGDLHFCVVSDGLLEELLPTLERAILAADKTADVTINGSEIRVTGKSGSIVFSSPTDLAATWARQVDATEEQSQILLELLSWEPLPVLTLSRAGQPAPVQVPDPRAFAFMAIPMQEQRAELGKTVAKLASESDQYQFPDQVLDAMPALAEAVGHRRMGITI